MGLSSREHSNSSPITSELYDKLLFEYHIHLLFVPIYPVLISCTFLASSILTRGRNSTKVGSKNEGDSANPKNYENDSEEGPQTGNRVGMQ